MKAPVYDMIHRAEQGWWYRGRMAAARAMLRGARVVPRGRALDYGAGHGAMRAFFAGYDPVDALEVYPEARATCMTRGYERVLADEGELLASAERYACVGAFDVIEHIEDDGGFLSRLTSRLEPGGILVVTVPAHQFLYGPYDEAAQHFRRYAKGELGRKLVAAGFEILRISYWNMALFPVAALLRLLGSESGGSLSPSPVVDKLLGWLVLGEALLLRLLPLPMGLSIVCVARVAPDRGPGLKADSAG